MAVAAAPGAAIAAATFPAPMPTVSDFQWLTGSQTPPTEATVIAQSPTIRPFVTDTTRLFATLRPGFATLPQSAPVLADAFAAGTRGR